MSAHLNLEGNVVLWMISTLAPKAQLLFLIVSVAWRELMFRVPITTLLTFFILISLSKTDGSSVGSGS